jgi:hypothetical protein
LLFPRTSLSYPNAALPAYDFILASSFERASNSNYFPGTITKVDGDNENGKPENTPENYYNHQDAIPIEDVLELWVDLE